ncbi:MAG: polymorphic toxin-type HINT domain-containing protein [Isosphaeraceae bacterium]|nr:polymorphic toxin-type HINT domain-containing protein [Isosphaeraceae bacterium]
MFSAFLFCSALLVAPSTDDRAAYEAAKAQAGRDASAHVELALWCEQHGLTTERAKHLALAVLNDPRNAMARGLMGLVQDQGAWRRPEDVSAKLKANAGQVALRAEYNEKRVRAPHTSDGQWKLALWCEENSLKPEARAHFTAVVKLDPKREAAWKRLGFKRQGNRWVTEAQLAAEKQERALQENADKRWKPLLERWRSLLGDKGRRHDDAEHALASITDPRAVPMVVAVLGAGSPERQATAVRVLGQIDAPAASRALALFAVFGKALEVRRVATETLRKRDVREFADLLAALVRDPIKYEVRHVNGPGSQGELFVQGKQVNYKRLYSSPALAALPPGGQLGYDANGLPVVNYTTGVFGQTPFLTPNEIGMLFVPPPSISPALQQTMTQVFQKLGAGQSSHHMSDLLLSSASSTIGAYNTYAQTAPFQQAMSAELEAMRPFGTCTSFSVVYGDQINVPVGRMMIEARKAVAAAQQQLQNDVQALDAINSEIRKYNDRVLPILTQISGQDFGPDRDAWENWVLDQIGFRKMPQKASDTTTIVEDVPLAYQAAQIPVSEVAGPVGYQRISCFGKGTPVRTLSGTQPIETLLPGDLVLAQNVQTGALGYQPILAVHHNPPGKTFRVALGTETIVSSEFHRFWKAGHGWVMARDLKPGDTLRTLGGLMAVSSIDTGKVEPVFNLDVADDADFFVGRGGALVHDNTLPDLRLTPFDAAAELTAATSR